MSHYPKFVLIRSASFYVVSATHLCAYKMCMLLQFTLATQQG